MAAAGYYSNKKLKEYDSMLPELATLREQISHVWWKQILVEEFVDNFNCFLFLGRWSETPAYYVGKGEDRLRVA